MTPEYLPTDIDTQRVHIIEEMAEVLQAYAKIKRFGEFSVNPKLPPEEQVTNLDSFHEELADLESAISRYYAAYFAGTRVPTDFGELHDGLPRSITLD